MIPNFPNRGVLDQLIQTDVDTVRKIIVAEEDPQNPGHPVGETPDALVWLVLGAAPANPAPTGAISINGGQATTNALAVTLSLTGSADAVEMRVSNASDFAGASWEAFSTSKAWNLTAGADGSRTVYLKLRDAQQVESYTYQDSISYETSLPTATVTGTPSSPTNATTVDLTVGGTGVTHYKYRWNGSAWSAQTAVSTHIQLQSLAEGAHTIDVIGYDGADWQLEANPTTVGWTVDTVAPVTSANPAGGTYGSGQSVVLSANKAVLGTYFTTDGTTPVYPISGTTQLYAGPVNIGSSGSLKFFSRSLAAVAEAVKTQTYTITGSNQAPGTPTGLTAGTYLSDGSGFTLSWNAATDPDGTIAFYKVYKGGQLYQTNVSAANAYLAITGQAQGSNAQWTVSAVDNFGAEGAQSTGLSVTTQDNTPNTFAFSDQTNVGLSVTCTSDQITVGGINVSVAISVTGGEYQIGAGAWTSAAGSVSNGNQVRVRHTSSGSLSTATNTTLTIGGVSDTFTSTTTVGLSESVYFDNTGTSVTDNLCVASRNMASDFWGDIRFTPAVDVTVSKLLLKMRTEPNEGFTYHNTGNDIRMRICADQGNGQPNYTSPLATLTLTGNPSADGTSFDLTATIGSAGDNYASAIAMTANSKYHFVLDVPSGGGVSYYAARGFGGAEPKVDAGYGTVAGGTFTYYTDYDPAVKIWKVA